MSNDNTKLTFSKNESGQVLIATVILLPLIISSVMLILFIIQASLFEARALSACRKQAAISQLRAGLAARSLMRLNPIATQLETRRQVAIKAFLLAIDPAEKALALAALRAIEMSQIPVITEQTYWLSQGRLISLRMPYDMKHAMKQKLPELNSMASTQFKTITPHFDIRPDSSVARTPNYYPTKDFTQKQNGGIKWSTNLTIRNLSTASLNIGCSSTLDSSFHVTPTEDKLL